MPAGTALEQGMGSSGYPAVGGTIAARAAKPDGPARLLQRFRALRFCAATHEKLGHRQTGLKLDSVRWHGSFRTRKDICTYSIMSSAGSRSPLRIIANQVPFWGDSWKRKIRSHRLGAALSFFHCPTGTG